MQTLIENLPIIIIIIFIVGFLIAITKYAPILICQKNPLTGQCLDSTLNNTNNMNNKRQ